MFKERKLRQIFKPITPIGLGTDHVESLPGYIARLVEKNDCSISDMINWANDNIEGFSFERNKYANSLLPQISNIHTSSLSSSNILQILLEVTGLQKEQLESMTAQRMGHVFGLGITKKTTWWSPEFYSNTSDRYEKLIWQLSGVYLDGRGNPLTALCPQCGRQQRHIALNKKIGFCLNSRCKASLEELGEREDLADEKDGKSIRDPNLKHYLSLYHKQISELMNFGEELKGLDITELFRSFYKRFGFRNTSQAEGRLQMNHLTLEKWLNGRKPKLKSLVDVLVSAQVPMVDFLNQRQINVSGFESSSFFKRPQLNRKEKYKRRRVNKSKVKELIEKDLSQGSFLHLPLIKYCKLRLGHDKESLERHFKDELDEWRGIRLKHKNIGAEITRAKRESAIKIAARYCADNGYCVNGTNVGFYLRIGGELEGEKSSYLRAPWAQQLMQEIRDKLPPKS